MKPFKKLTVLAVLIFCLCSFLPGPLVLGADNTMTASQQVTAINAGWNLGNTLDSYGTWITDVNPNSVETAWGNPVTTQAMIQAVKDRGFNTIRIPVTWAQFTDASGNVDPSWMQRVKTVVDWSLDAGLYVILNVHHDTGEHGSDKVCWLIADTGTYDSVNSRFAGLWNSIAEEFKDYDNRLMFEGYNEMLDMNNSWNAPTTGDGALDAVNSFAQTFVDTVRATGGNNATRNLIVNTYVASADPTVLSGFVLPQDTVSDHLICEVHAYTPYQFCSAEADGSYTSFDSNCQSQIDNLMSSLSSFSGTIGVPVIIGEFGVENQNNDSDRAAYAAYYLQKATQNNIRCIWWDNGITDYGGYAILDRNSLTWNEEITSAILDNAPSEGSAPDEVLETTETSDTEVSEQTTASFETEATQASVTESVDDTSVSLEQQDETSDLQNLNGNKKSLILSLTIGLLLIAGIYTGLFFLGRRNGMRR